MLCSFQSALAKTLVTVPEEGAATTLLSARAARNQLLTVLLVVGAGRPSHVTGIKVDDLETARVSWISLLPCTLNPRTCRGGVVCLFVGA